MEKNSSVSERQDILKRLLQNKAAVAVYSLFMAVCAVIAVLSMIAPWTNREIPLLELAGKISPYTSLAVCISNMLMLVAALKSKTGLSEAQAQLPVEKKP